MFSSYSMVNVGIPPSTRPVDEIRGAEIREPGVQESGLAERLCGLRRGSRALRRFSKTTVGAIPALMGHLQIIRGSVSGIPYCRRAPRQVGLEGGSDKKLLLQWTSLRMMRRYFGG